MVYDHIDEKGRCGACGCACADTQARCDLCGVVFIPKDWPREEAEGLMLRGMLAEADSLMHQGSLPRDAHHSLRTHLQERVRGLAPDPAPNTPPPAADDAPVDLWAEMKAYAKAQSSNPSQPSGGGGAPESPPVESPPVEAPPVEAPPVEAPPLEADTSPLRFHLPTLNKDGEGEASEERQSRFSGEELGYLVGALLTLVGSFYFAGTHWGAMGSLLQNLLALVFVLGYSSLFLFLGRRTEGLRGMALGSRVLGGLSLALWPVSALALDGVWPISPLVWVGGWLSVLAIGRWGVPRAFKLLGARGAHRSALAVALIAGLSGPFGAIGVDSALPWLGLAPLAWGLRSYLTQKGFERPGFLLGLGVQIYGFIFLLTLALLGGAGDGLWPLIPALGALALYWDVALGRWYGVHRHYLNRLPGAIALSLGVFSTLIFGMAGILDAGGWWILSGALGWILTLGAGVLYKRRGVGRLGLMGSVMSVLGILSWGGDGLLSGLNSLARFLGGQGGEGWMLLPGLLLPLCAGILARALGALGAQRLRLDAHILMGLSLGALTLLGLASRDWNLILALMALPSLAFSWSIYRAYQAPWSVWPLAAFGATGLLGTLSALGATDITLAGALALYGAAIATLGRRLWPASPFPILGRQLQWAGGAAWALATLSLWSFAALQGPEPTLLTAMLLTSTLTLSFRGLEIPEALLQGVLAISMVATLAVSQGLLMMGLVGVEGALVLSLGCVVLFGAGYRHRWRWIFNLGHLALIPAALGWPLLFRYALKPFVAQASDLLGYGGARLPLAFYGLTLLPLVLVALAMAWGLRSRGRQRLAQDALLWGATLAGALALISLTKPGELRPPSVSLLLTGGLYSLLAHQGRGRAFAPLAALALLGWSFVFPGLLGASLLWRGVILAWAGLGLVKVLLPRLSLSWEVGVIGEGALALGGVVALYGVFVLGALSIPSALGLGLLALAFGIAAQERPLLGPAAYGFALIAALVMWSEVGILTLGGALGALASLTFLAYLWQTPRLSALRSSFLYGGLGLTFASVVWIWGMRMNGGDWAPQSLFPGGILILLALFLARSVWRGKPFRWALGLALSAELLFAAHQLDVTLAFDIALAPLLLALGAAIALWRLPALSPYWQSTCRWILALGPIATALALESTDPLNAPLPALITLALALAYGALAGHLTQRRRHLFVALGGLLMLLDLPIYSQYEPLLTSALGLGLGLLSLKVGLTQGGPLLGLDAWRRPGRGDIPPHLAHSLPLWLWGVLFGGVSLIITLLTPSGSLFGVVALPALVALLTGLSVVVLMPRRLSPALLGALPALVSFAYLSGGPWPILALSLGGLALLVWGHRHSALALTALALFCLVPWAAPLGMRGALSIPFIPLVIAAFGVSLWGLGRDKEEGAFLIPSLLLGDLALMSTVAWLGVLMDTGRPEAALLPAFALAMGGVSLLFSRERIGAFSPWGSIIAPAHALVGCLFVGGSMALLDGANTLDHGMVLTALAMMALGGALRARRLTSPGEVLGVEALVLVAYLYLRISTPLGDALLGWDAPLAMVLAFILFAIGSFAKAKKIAFAERPLLWTSLALPVVAFSLSFGEGHTGGALWGALGTVYLAHYLLEPRRGVLLTAMGLYNLCVFAVWVKLGVSNLQLFALPLGLSLALIAHIYRRSFSMTTLNILRYSGALIIFGASVFESLMSPWNSLALILLGLLSLLAGGVLKIRSYLNMGALGVCLALVLNLARFGLAYREFWALSLTVLGIGLLVGLSVYSWRRDHIEARLDRFRHWVGALE